LHADKLSIEIEDHVVATTLGYRKVDLNAKLRRLELNGEFGDRSFLVRCHIRQRSDRIGWTVSV